jgi:hypothetical protein
MPKKTIPRKGRLRDFVQRVNSDPLVRVQFLANPDQALDEIGIQLSEELKSELRALVQEYIERYPNIALLPTGVSRRSRERAGLAAKAHPESECDEETVFLI